MIERQLIEVGNTIHLNGIRAEYQLFGRKSSAGCILPDGDYVILGLEKGYLNLAWREADGRPSRKHRYRIPESEVVS